MSQSDTPGESILSRKSRKVDKCVIKDLFHLNGPSDFDHCFPVVYRIKVSVTRCTSRREKEGKFPIKKVREEIQKLRSNLRCFYKKRRIERYECGLR